MLWLLKLIWQAIKGGFIHVADFLSECLGWFVDTVLLPAFSWLGDVIYDFGVWLSYQLLEFLRTMMEYARSMGLDIDPEKVISAVNDLWQFCVKLNYLIPIGTMLLIWLAALTAMMIIRLIRNIKSFVPGLGD